METQGYIFDYGGTLDTDGCHWGKMIWHAYKRQNIPIKEDMFRKAYVHAERMLGKHPIIQSDYTFLKTLKTKIRIEFEYLLQKRILTSSDISSTSLQSAVVTDLYHHVQKVTAKSRNILLNLKERHPIVLVSNFYGNMSVVLHEFGLNDIFDDVVESAIVKVRKPDPAIFQIGINKLKMEPKDVIVVGDSYTKDILPAHETGCKTVWLKGEGWTEEKYPNCVADKIITHLKQLTDRPLGNNNKNNNKQAQ